MRLSLPDLSVLLISPGDLHTDYLHADVCYRALRVELDDALPSEAPAPLLNPSAPPQRRWARAQASPLWALLQEIDQATQSDDPLNLHLREALAGVVFWSALQCLPAGTIAESLIQSSRDRRLRERLHEIFMDHLYHPLSMAEMARATGLSPRGLHQFTTRTCGLSPARAHLRFRLEFARKALRETDDTIKEISLRLGFTDPYHFSRMYRRHFGQAPSHERA